MPEAGQLRPRHVNGRALYRGLRPHGATRVRGRLFCRFKLPVSWVVLLDGLSEDDARSALLRDDRWRSLINGYAHRRNSLTIEGGWARVALHWFATNEQGNRSEHLEVCRAVARVLRARLADALVSSDTVVWSR